MMMYGRIPITDRRVRIAVVGCGRIANNHFNAIEQHKERAQLVAVCDTDKAALQAAASKHNVQGFGSLGELLDQSDADVVALCTPSGLHPRQTIRIAAGRRHIMTEKPMATRWTDGLQ